MRFATPRKEAPEDAISVHGHDDTPALREQVRETLESEELFAPGAGEQEPLPG